MEQLRESAPSALLPNAFLLLRAFFGRRRSRWAGALARVRLPVAVREPLLRAFAALSGAELREVKLPLREFRSFNDFFCRELREGARAIASVPDGLVSPADAKVLALGAVSNGNSRVEQVKGTTYSVQTFLGLDPTRHRLNSDSLVYYIVLYLGPGNYHRVHSPCDVTFQQGRHFTGEFFPLRDILLRNMDDILCVNERVVLSGRWSHGSLHLAMVAAANVGNIFLDFDPKLRTNRDNPVCGVGDVFSKMYPSGVDLQAGEKVGGFRLGSTVVLVFEAPEGFRWRVGPGDEVRVGQPLGEGSPASDACCQDR